MKLLTGALVIATAALSHAAAPLYQVPRLDQIVIDGDTADWQGRCFAVDILVPAEGSLPARAKFSGALRLGWNETGLLVGVTVTGRDWKEAAK